MGHADRLFGAAGLLLVMMIMTIANTGCSVAGTRVRQDSKMPSVWVLENGKAQVLVDGKLGRIMGYSFVGGENVLWTNPEAALAKYDVGGWMNWGGDKVWPWPQDLFGWPPPEPAYEIRPTESGDGLVMTSEVIPSVSARVVRTIELADDSSAMVVTSRLEPVGAVFGRPMSAWSITQVPTPQSVYVRIALAGDRERYLRRTAKDGFRATAVGGSVVRLENAGEGGKTFMDADVIAAVFDETVLLMRQVPAHSEGVWAADERAQVYAHPANAANVPPGRSYYELEYSAPVLPRNAIEKAPLRVIYKLVKIEKDTTQAQIVEMMQKLP